MKITIATIDVAGWVRHGSVWDLAAVMTAIADAFPSTWVETLDDCKHIIAYKLDVPDTQHATANDLDPLHRADE